MRALLVSAAAIAFAGCSVSIPVSPEQRADLPPCPSGQIPSPSASGAAVGCVDPSTLVGPSVGSVSEAEYATHAKTAQSTRHASQAAAAQGPTATGEVVIGDDGGTRLLGVPGLQVLGGAAVDQSVVPFFVAAFDSTAPSSTPPVLAGAGATMSIPFPSTPSFTLPGRPANPFGQDTYLVTFSASGALTADADPAKDQLTECQVTLNIARTDVAGPALSVLTTVGAYGKGASPQAEIPWQIHSTLPLNAGSYSLDLVLSMPSSSDSDVAPSCQTHVNPGEEAHIQVEAL